MAVAVVVVGRLRRRRHASHPVCLLETSEFPAEPWLFHSIRAQRAWRAPNHPQASFLTCSALEDLAAKLKMDPVELFNRNLEYTVHRKRIGLSSRKPRN